MKGTGVYSITNKVNGKRYVGSTQVSFEERWRHHKRGVKINKHHSQKLQRAWNKYGADNFVFEVLATCPREYCIRLEQWFLDNLKPEYNISPTASSCYGIKKTTEQIESMRKRVKAFMASDDGKKKISEAQKKRFEREEERQKAGKASRDYNTTEYARQKNREKAIKQFSDPKNRESARERTLRQMSDKDAWERNREAVAEAMRRPEVRIKNSEAKKRYLSNPDNLKAHKDARCKFIYKIEKPNGEIVKIKYVQDFIKEENLNAGVYTYWKNKKSFKGYKLLSKTPIK